MFISIFPSSLADFLRACIIKQFGPWEKNQFVTDSLQGGFFISSSTVVNGLTSSPLIQYSRISPREYPDFYPARFADFFFTKHQKILSYINRSQFTKLSSNFKHLLKNLAHGKNQFVPDSLYDLILKPVSFTINFHHDYASCSPFFPVCFSTHLQAVQSTVFLLVPTSCTRIIFQGLCLENGDGLGSLLGLDLFVHVIKGLIDIVTQSL